MEVQVSENYGKRRVESLFSSANRGTKRTFDGACNSDDCCGSSLRVEVERREKRACDGRYMPSLRESQFLIPKMEVERVR